MDYMVKNIMDFNTKTEYEYILKNADDLTKYSGRWIAVLGEEVICNNKDLAKLWTSFQKLHPNKIPFFMKIPDKNLLVL